MPYAFNPFTGKLDVIPAPTTITLTGDATGSGTTTISTSINTFSGSAKGLVPTSPGGTTNFLRADGSWAPAGGAASLTETELDFGTKPVPSKSFVVTDASVSPTSKVTVSPSSKTATGRVGTDDMEWDGIILSALPGSGNFTVHAVAVPGPVVGKRKIHYLVG